MLRRLLLGELIQMRPSLHSGMARPPGTRWISGLNKAPFPLVRQISIVRLIYFIGKYEDKDCSDEESFDVVPGLPGFTRPRKHPAAPLPASRSRLGRFGYRSVEYLCT
ncbi:uncharacterized protein L3040_004413 [Drepanopeziza brunnea f. sp. 'multigermtubi']|uniref:uncharacterized protein n=1 Tax=Drepanopeziza brunnea f. sp. 'multigermtubi' TaxID=698441 RepID=UPI00239152F5|nr:hypothetical protein L3040_004413 [Drepanopeziza brunnea f. sp. 'multigermtubi']